VAGLVAKHARGVGSAALLTHCTVQGCSRYRLKTAAILRSTSGNTRGWRVHGRDGARLTNLSCCRSPRVTDEPPPQVAAVGHDRCISPIKHENIDAWLNLNPDRHNLQAQYAIPDDRERPCYEHRLAA